MTVTDERAKQILFVAKSTTHQRVWLQKRFTVITNTYFIKR